MKKTMMGRMTKALLLATGVVALSSPSFALGVCTGVPTSISALIAAGGCSFGGISLTLFDLTGSSGVAADINPANIGVSVNGVGTAVNVVLTPLNTTWSVSGTNQFTINLTYTVAGGPWFTKFGDSLQGVSVVAPGSVSMTKIINPGGSAQAVNAHDMFPTPALVNLTGAPLSTFVVNDNFQVAASTQSASVNSATNIFIIPEPMTSVFLGSGLLALGLLLRRKRA